MLTVSQTNRVDAENEHAMPTWTLCGTHSVHGRIVLISAPDDPARYRIGLRRGRPWTVNLGLLHLASHLQAHGWRFETAHPVAGTGSMGALCQGAWVGISAMPSSYMTAMSIARNAKASDARAVVLGGPYPTSRAPQILANRETVDHVIVGPGEVALLRLISGVPAESIPGLASRSLAGPKVVEPEFVSLGGCSVVDRGLWPVANGAPGQNDYAVTYFQDGCPVAQREPCVFCTCWHSKKVSRKHTRQVLAELTQLRALGYTAIEDGGDDFASGGGPTRNWLLQLGHDMEMSGICFNWLVHASVRSLSYPGMLDALAGIGVRVIQIGFESGDASLKVAGKTSVKEENELLLQVQRLGMRVCGSWVLGMPGETAESARRTVAQACDLYAQGVLAGIQMDPLWPGPGSRAFELVCRVHPQWRNADFVQPEELMAAWYSNYTLTTLDHVLSMREEALGHMDVDFVGGMLL